MSRVFCTKTIFPIDCNVKISYLIVCVKNAQYTVRITVITFAVSVKVSQRGVATSETEFITSMRIDTTPLDSRNILNCTKTVEVGSVRRPFQVNVECFPLPNPDLGLFLSQQKLKYITKSF